MGANCVASASIGCLYCCKGCNAEKLRNAFTFLPPEASYFIEPTVLDKSKGQLMYRREDVRRFELYREAAKHSEVRWVTTKRGSTNPFVWVWRDQNCGSSSSVQTPLIILHCHGNATDIGLMMSPYYQLVKCLGVEVVGVEYSGYGESSERPTWGKTLADVEAVYDYLVNEVGVPSDRIVAYGQSVGSGPVGELMHRKKLGGVILHSPLLSGIRVVDPEPYKCCRPSCIFSCLDFYPNIYRVKEASCPVMVIHGQEDRVVPFYHGVDTWKAVPEEHRWRPYFPEDAGHNDIVEKNERAFLGEVSAFLMAVKLRASGQNVDMPKAEEAGHRNGHHVPTLYGSRMHRAETLPKRSAGLQQNAREVRMLAGPEDGRYERLREGCVEMESLSKSRF